MRIMDSRNQVLRGNTVRLVKVVTPQNPGVPLTTVNLWKPMCLIS